MKTKFDFTIWGFWITFIALVIAVVFFFISIKNPKLEIVQTSNSKLITSEQDLSDISILYKNEDLKKTHKNISLFIIRIVNRGKEIIRLEDFDDGIKYGILLKDGITIINPQVIGSSNSDYYSRAIYSFDDDSIILNTQIFNKKDFFDLKFYVLHNDSIAPFLKSFGVIAGQATIPLKNLEISEEQESSTKYYIILFVGLFLLMIIFVVTNYLMRNIGSNMDKVVTKTFEKFQELKLAEADKFQNLNPEVYGPIRFTAHGMRPSAKLQPRVESVDLVGDLRSTKYAKKAVVKKTLAAAKKGTPKKTPTKKAPKGKRS